MDYIILQFHQTFNKIICLPWNDYQFISEESHEIIQIFLARKLLKWMLPAIGPPGRLTFHPYRDAVGNRNSPKKYNHTDRNHHPGRTRAATPFNVLSPFAWPFTGRIPNGIAHRPVALACAQFADKAAITWLASGIFRLLVAAGKLSLANGIRSTPKDKYTISFCSCGARFCEGIPPSDLGVRRILREDK